MNIDNSYEPEPFVTAEYCASRLGISCATFLKKRDAMGVIIFRFGHRTVRYLWSQVKKAFGDGGSDPCGSGGNDENN